MRRFCPLWLETSPPATQSILHLAEQSFLSLCSEILTPQTRMSPFTAMTRNLGMSTYDRAAGNSCVLVNRQAL